MSEPVIVDDTDDAMDDDDDDAMANDNDNYNNDYYERATTRANGLLSKLFVSCSSDPRGSVHRAWGVSLIFVILYFVVSVFESKCRGGMLVLCFVTVLRPRAKVAGGRRSSRVRSSQSGQWSSRRTLFGATL